MYDQAPLGQRFSHVHLSRGEPIRDSLRMRKRLYSTAPVKRGLPDYLAKELGVTVRSFEGAIYESFFEKAELRDVLDSITLIAKWLAVRDETSLMRGWIAETSRILREENLGYRVDELGGVHYLEDGHFEGLRTAGISSLNGQRYANSLALFEGAYSSLDTSPPDGKSAVRNLFASVEGLFRLMFPSAQRLGTSEVTTHLMPVIQAAYPSDLTARRASVKMVGSFQGWVEAAHFYRHEPGQEEVAQPPMTVAILLISEGAGYLRWLAEIDRWAK